MRLALITARKNGSRSFTTIREPGEPKAARAAFKQLVQTPGDLAEIHLWDSQAGIEKKKIFRGFDDASTTQPPAGAPSPSDQDGEATGAAEAGAGDSDAGDDEGPTLGDVSGQAAGETPAQRRGRR